MDIIINSIYLLSVVPQEESLTSTSNWSSTLQMLGQFFFLIAVFAIIVFLSVYSLKFASKFKNFSGGGNNVKLIETRPLGSGNFVHLIKVGSKYILAGSSKDNVTFLTDVDKDAIMDSFSETTKSPKGVFDSVLSKHISGFKNRRQPPGE